MSEKVPPRPPFGGSGDRTVIRPNPGGRRPVAPTPPPNQPPPAYNPVRPSDYVGQPQPVPPQGTPYQPPTTPVVQNPDEWIAFGADYFGIERATMAKSIEREMSGLHFDGEIDLSGLQQAIDLQVRLGALKQALRAQDIVDLRFLPVPPAMPARPDLERLTE